MKIPKYVSLVLILLSFYSLTTYFHLHGYDDDLWFHAAAIQSLATSPLVEIKTAFITPPGYHAPVMPFSYTPYALMLAMIHKAFGVSPLLLLNLGGLVNFILFAGGLHLFLRETFSDRELSLYMLPTMLFFWGKSWDMSGFYDIGAQVKNLSSPYTLASALSFFTLALFQRYLRNGKTKNWILLLFSLSLLMLTHLQPAFFALGSMVLLYGLKKDWRWQRLLMLASLGVLSILLTTAWPYYSLFQQIIKGAPVLRQYFDASWYVSEYLQRLGPALLGVPLVLFYAAKKKYPLVGLGALLFLMAFFISFLMKNPFGWRFIVSVTFFLHLSIALFMRDHFPALAKPLVLSKKNFFTVALVVVAMAVVFYQAVGMTAKQLGFRSFGEALNAVETNPMRGRGFARRFQDIVRRIPSDSVILSDSKTSMILASFGANCSSFKDKLDFQEFFSIDTPLIRRLEILREYRVNYVLWNSDRLPMPFPDDLLSKGKVLYREGPFLLVGFHET